MALEIDWKLAIELVSPALMFLGAGRWIGRIERVAKEVDEDKKLLKLIPDMRQLLELTHRRLDVLERRHDSTRTHAIRAETRSEVDAKERDE